jgi:apolipoprotein N-acyltransferase
MQAAELVGAPLVSMILVYACLDIGARLERGHFRPRLSQAGPLLLAALAIGLGWWRMQGVEAWASLARTLRVGVVQADPAYQDATAKMRAASDRLPPVDLLAWPESTLGTYSTAVTGLGDIQQDVAIAHAPFIDTTPVRDAGAWLLVGGKTFEPGAGDEGPYFQTAYLIDPRGEFVARYFKRALLPIGEYMPLEGSQRWLHQWAQLSEYTAAGDSDAPVRVDGRVEVGVLLCYEDIVARLSRRTVAQGAEILVCLINAAAFEEPLSLEQHRRLAMVRAIENRRSLVRSSATGVSCCIGPSGRTAVRLPMHAEGEFAVSAPLNSQLTAFDRGGYWMPHGAAAAIAIYVAARRLRLRGSA